MGFYSKRHYRQVGGFYSKDTPDAIAERIRRAKAGELGHKDMVAKFPQLTAANASEAISYQASRIQFHYDYLSSHE